MRANRIPLIIFVFSLVVISLFAWNQYRKAAFYKGLAVDSIIARGGQLVVIDRLMLKHDCPDDQKHLIYVLASESLERIQENERFILETIPVQQERSYREMVRKLGEIVERSSRERNRE